jgi:uncharacterized phage protein gp47/JayE
MILYNKTEEELNREALELLSQTAITNTKQGSRAQTILRIINKVLKTYYDALDFNVTMAFVSKAAGAFLDEIGLLLNCTRRTGEEDNNYRYRITNQVYVVEGANKTAIRLAALSVDRVLDVILTPFVFGTGSFTVHVITNTMDEAIVNQTISRVQEVLDEVAAYGVKGVAVAPKVVAFWASIRLFFVSSTNDDTKATIANNIRTAIEEYISNLNMGADFVLSEVVYIAKSIGRGYIQDVVPTKIEIGRRKEEDVSVTWKQVLIQNYKPYWDEKLFISEQRSIVVEY